MLPSAPKFAALSSGLRVALLNPTSPVEATLMRETRPLGARSAAGTTMGAKTKGRMKMSPPTTERLWPAGTCSVLPRIAIGAGCGVRNPKEDGGAAGRATGVLGVAGNTPPAPHRTTSAVLT